VLCAKARALTLSNNIDAPASGSQFFAPFQRYRPLSAIEMDAPASRIQAGMRINAGGSIQADGGIQGRARF
jgi:hypothetical protein